MIQTKLNDYFVGVVIAVATVVDGKKKYCSTYFCCIYLSVDTNKCHVYPCFAAIQPLACCRPFARYIFIE